jgi:riboflavin kinase/FMN adenylyltransferase
VVTIGVFDGVHRGHQAVIAHTVESARQQGCRAVVLTFDPNPLEVLRPELAPTRLCGIGRRVELIEALGVDAVEVLPFTDELSQMSPEEFTHEILQRRLGAWAVVVGEGFRFGHRAAGPAQTLRALDLDVSEYALVSEGLPVSSTRIRAAVAEGDMGAASGMLGRPHEVEGVVVRGQQRGKDLGYPTANVHHHGRAAVPADGVYAGRAVLTTGTYPAAISVGTNPTFDGTTHTVEAYLLDFDADLYGQPVRVEFAHRLRGMLTFDGAEALIAQMEQDVEQARRLLQA